MANYARKNTQASNVSELPQALGFINLSIPANTPSGAKKIGTIVLQENDESHAHIFEKLAADPKLAQKFVKNLIVEFRANTKAEPIDEKQLDSLFK